MRARRSARPASGVTTLVSVRPCTSWRAPRARKGRSNHVDQPRDARAPTLAARESLSAAGLLLLLGELVPQHLLAAALHEMAVGVDQHGRGKCVDAPVLDSLAARVEQDRERQRLAFPGTFDQRL